MQIHIVNEGETINSIANLYNIPVNRLLSDNSLPPNSNPNIGQSLIITNPEQTYIVREGDTLSSIAGSFNTTPIELIKVNSYITNRGNKAVNPGEEIVIRYSLSNNTIQINGFTTTYISQDILERTLPSLTYLTILNYQVLATGDISDISDINIINTAKAYGVVPIMFVSSMDTQGRGSYAVTHSLCTNPDVQNRFIDNILTILRSNDIYGVNFGFYSILEDDLPAYVSLISNVTNILNNEGYVVFATLNPNTWRYNPSLPYTLPFISQVGNAANYVILMNYLWATTTMEQYEYTTPAFLKQYLDFVITQISPEKIFIGLSRLAYDWELPYAEFETKQSLLTNVAATFLANELGIELKYDDRTQTPYFNYNTSGTDHLVWFKDSRSVQALLNMIVEYNLKGLAVWNILYYGNPTWLPIYSQFNVENVLNNVPSEETT